MTTDRTPLGPRRGLRWFLGGCTGVDGLFALEALVRQPGSASDLRSSRYDDASTRHIVVASALALLSAPLLRRLPIRPLPIVFAPVGLAVLVAGLALRVWSMQTLSDTSTRTLRVTNRQTVTDRGPYRHVRHPAYLGSLLIWCGFAFSSGRAVVVGAVAALLVPAYLHRVDAEEELLDRELPGYADYRSHTKRLVPHIW